jgi:hypothetical protein
MRKLPIILLFLIIYADIQANTNGRNCIAILYSQKSTLSQLYSQCKPINFGGKLVLPCGGKKCKEIFDQIISKEEDITKWYSNSSKIIDAFLIFYKQATQLGDSAYEGLNPYIMNDAVNDDFLVDIMVQCLGDTTNLRNIIIPEALNCLLNYTAYSQVKRQFKSIIKVENTINTKFNAFERLKIFACSDSMYEKKLLKRNDLLPLYRAKLGDTEYLDTLLNNFTKTNNYHEKSRIVNELFFIGSTECFVFLIQNINDSCISYCNGQFAESLKWPILVGFRKYFPEEKFSKSFANIINNGYKSDSLKVKAVYSEFVAWAQEKFKVSPKTEPSFYLFKQDCTYRDQ